MVSLDMPEAPQAYTLCLALCLARGRGLTGLRLLITLALLCGAVFLSPSAAAAGLVEGLRKYEAGDYAGAIEEWQPMAERGNAAALFNLGQLYRLGRGVAADAPRAEEYYRRAGDAGHAGARGVLATLYYFDHGSRQKRGEAIALWRQAAAAGDAPSQYMLAILHFNGQDVPKDLMQAYAWALLAAEGGLAAGQRAERSMHGHLSPNQLVQARALKAGLVIAKPTAPAASAPPPPLMPAPVPAPVPASLPAPAPEPEPVPEPAPVAEATPPVGAPKSDPPGLPADEGVAGTAEAPPGAWSLQLGFYHQRSNADHYWAGISGRVEALLPGVESRIVTIDYGRPRGIFFQLLAGRFDGRQEADLLCEDMKSIDIDCVIVTP